MTKQRNYLAEALLTLLVACAVFIPTVGFRLSGSKIEFSQLWLALGLAASTVALRLLWQGFLATPLGSNLLERFERGKRLHVTVARDEKHGQYTKYIAALIFVAGVMFPFFVSKYWITVMILAMIYVLLGLGLNIVVGLAGLLDLGYVAFYAIGAYSFALSAEHFPILGFWSLIPTAAILAALFGCVLGFPVLRMHGDYLAITTLGFGEIIRLVLINWVSFTHGPNGLSTPKPTLFNYIEFTPTAQYGGKPFHEIFGLSYSPAYLYTFIILVLLIVVYTLVYINHRLQYMPIGRAWEALREDEIACRSLGLNHVLIKLSAFAIGASIGGVAGVFFASYQGFVDPSSFFFFESALILAIVVLGGLGSTTGVIIAALVLTILPEVAREFSQFRVLVFGVAMVLMMVWRPRGFISPVRPFFRSTQDLQRGRA